MDKAGSVGLDLSFVSSVILMEPLNDPALEQQVVSRAHRMGARQPIYVETLVMKVFDLSPFKLPFSSRNEFRPFLFNLSSIFYSALFGERSQCAIVRRRVKPQTSLSNI
jgi:hypothetical protein